MPERILCSTVFKGSAVDVAAAVEEEDVAVPWKVSENGCSGSARCNVSRLSEVDITGVLAADGNCDSTCGSDCSRCLRDDDDKEDDALKSFCGIVSVGKTLRSVFPGSINSISILSAESDSSPLLSPLLGTFVAIRAVEQTYESR